MGYLDSFVCAVPNDSREAYRIHAERAAQVFRAFGAERVVDAWGDDIPEGKLTSFPMAVKCKENETVVLSWIIWPSKEVRDEGMAKFMKDPICNMEENPLPFDGQRMIFGGFNVLVDI